MAHYTITIKSLINNNFNFGLNNYPIFDENYRNTLNNNILNFYYNSEIGFETAELFKFYLNNTMSLIMPKYNELYNAQKKIITENLLLNNVNLTENYEGNNTRNDTNTNSSTGNSSVTGTDTTNNTENDKNLFQDTPQGELDNTDINNQRWATNLTLNNRTNNTTSNNSTTGTNSLSQESETESTGSSDYIKTIIGNNGNKFNIDLLDDIKNKLMNIDMMIINELQDLFMGIF